jgi:hypothetical protein
MIERLKPIPLVFWKSASGGEPARDWLNELYLSRHSAEAQTVVWITLPNGLDLPPA